MKNRSVSTQEAPRWMEENIPLSQPRVCSKSHPVVPSQDGRKFGPPVAGDDDHPLARGKGGSHDGLDDG